MVSSNKCYSRLDLANILRKAFPQYPLPSTTKDPEKMNPGFTMDSSRVERELGLKVHDIDEAVIGMARELIELGVVPKL